jgi:Flp pilus assembly protein TadB
MDENTLKQLWLDSDKEQKVEIDAQKLLESISKKISNMERLIKRRNRLEIFLAISMMPLFGWWLVVVPLLLVKIGAAIILLSCVLVIFRLTYAGKINIKVDTTSEIKLHLLVSLQRTRQEIRLHNTVLWWYLLPFFIGIICFFYAYLVTLLSKGIYTIIVAALYSYIYYLNKKVVKRKLKPLEDNLLKALDELSIQE